MRNARHQTTNLRGSAGAAYPLTELQHAYWLGEQEIYGLHTPAYFHCCYFTKALDVQRLEAAISAVVRSQPSLTAEILSNGTQRPLPPPERIQLQVHDYSHVTRATAKAYHKERKATLEVELTALGHGLQFNCFIDRLADGYYVHFLFRLVAFDAMSMWMFWSDMCGIYSGLRTPAPQAAQFADFVQHRHELMHGPAYQCSLEYWKKRAAELPGAPELPLVDHAAMPAKSTFRRIRLGLDAGQVAALHAQARRWGVGINSLLCTVYTDALRLWSKNSSFVINMLTTHRPKEDRFAHVYGNFGSTMPAASIDMPGGLPERARFFQRQLFRDLKHMQVSGVEVIRAMPRNASPLPAMPVVFASSLGLDLGHLLSPRDLGWEIRAGGLQTPQVLLDCQVYMDDDCMSLNWDYVAEAFRPGVVEDMFKAFVEQVLNLAEGTADEPQLPQVPANDLAARRAANATEKPLPKGLLHEFFAEACRRHPDRLAIVSDARTLSYQTLWCLTTRLAARLRQLHVGPNDLVAIVAQRGWRQVAAAMAVVQAGGAYLPIASNLPAERISWLVGQQDVKVVLVERDLVGTFELPVHAEMLRLERELPDGDPGPGRELPCVQGPQDLAYVIFTSGSTGQPKGVMIDHRGAVNTIQDVATRFSLNAADRVIGISAFNFDLSVFDIFGTLGAGAALVLPPHSDTPAPDDWARMVRDHQVTVWNTVPALMEMQLESLGERSSTDLASLRLVMLSGDWIPIGLPGRLRSRLPNAMLVSLGGATEASIWSNYFVIDQVDAAWKSIPYGWPLSNQSLHVLAKDLRDAPTWVPGELYIGGMGVAHGYYQDPERTSASFIVHPETGERLYRTGDMACYHDNGCIEFLGRNDDQVKIRGFRIELGEIDAVMSRCPGIVSAVTVVRQRGSGGDHFLVALYVPESDDLDQATIHAHLSRTLPDYMVPAQFVALERIPMTANGKVDRKALADIASAVPPLARISRAPRTANEQRLAVIWQELLRIDPPGVDDNFFELGGTSLSAVRLLNAIAAEFGHTLPLTSLLKHSTIAAQAAQLARGGAGLPVRGPLVTLREGARSALVVVHPVGGNVLCYRELSKLVPEGMAVLALQSSGDGAARDVGEMAARYVDALLGHACATRPLHLLGWSMGGVVAHEMTRQLEARGVVPAGLTLIDSWRSAQCHTADRLTGYPLLHNFVRDLLGGAPMPKAFAAIGRLDASEQHEAAVAALHESGTAIGQLSVQEFADLLAEYAANYSALVRHLPQAVRTPARLFVANRSQRFPLLVRFGASDCGPATQIAMDEDHFSIVRGDALRAIVAASTGSGGVQLSMDAERIAEPMNDQ